MKKYKKIIQLRFNHAKFPVSITIIDVNNIMVTSMTDHLFTHSYMMFEIIFGIAATLCKYWVKLTNAEAYFLLISFTY